MFYNFLGEKQNLIPKKEIFLNISYISVTAPRMKTNISKWKGVNSKHFFHAMYKKNWYFSHFAIEFNLAFYLVEVLWSSHTYDLFNFCDCVDDCVNHFLHCNHIGWTNHNCDMHPLRTVQPINQWLFPAVPIVE